MEMSILRKILYGVYENDIKQVGADEFLEGLVNQADLTDDEVEFLRPLVEEIEVM